DSHGAPSSERASGVQTDDRAAWGSASAQVGGPALLRVGVGLRVQGLALDVASEALGEGGRAPAPHRGNAGVREPPRDRPRPALPNFFGQRTDRMLQIHELEGPEYLVQRPHRTDPLDRRERADVRCAARPEPRKGRIGCEAALHLGDAIEGAAIGVAAQGRRVLAHLEREVCERDDHRDRAHDLTDVCEILKRHRAPPPALRARGSLGCTGGRVNPEALLSVPLGCFAYLSRYVCATSPTRRPKASSGYRDTEAKAVPRWPWDTNYYRELLV